MKRGEVWAVCGGKDYGGKRSPAVMVQDDTFDATASIAVCAFTTETASAPPSWLPIERTERNGLRSVYRLMAAGRELLIRRTAYGFGNQTSTRPGASGDRALSAGVGRYTFTISGPSRSSIAASIL